MEHADVEELLERLAPVCQPLHEALADGAAEARSHLDPHGMTTEEYTWIVTHLSRAHALRLINASGLPEGWGMRSHALNGRFQMNHGGLVLRMLHDPVVTVPAPGQNLARRDFFSNERWTLFGEVENTNLLGLWNVNPDSGESAIRIVRTIGTWRYAEAAKTDLTFWLPDDEMGMGDLRFTTPDAGIVIDLPSKDLGNEEETGDGPVRG